MRPLEPEIAMIMCAAARVRDVLEQPGRHALRPIVDDEPTALRPCRSALADFNLIDYDALTLGVPYVTNDLPAGGRRLLQKAS